MNTSYLIGLKKSESTAYIKIVETWYLGRRKGGDLLYFRGVTALDLNGKRKENWVTQNGIEKPINSYCGHGPALIQNFYLTSLLWVDHMSPIFKIVILWFECDPQNSCFGKETESLGWQCREEGHLGGDWVMYALPLGVDPCWYCESSFVISRVGLL
jgi:hypothetical protein